jgi:hypothetical protein
MTGRERGFDWAQDAKQYELDLLAKFAQVFPVGSSARARWLSACANNSYSAAEGLFFAIHPDLTGDRQAAADFWGGDVDDRCAQQFVEGALQYLDALAGGFDFTLDCPVFLLSPGEGFLLTDDRVLCLWTDADAATIFLNRSHRGHLSTVEIATDEELLALLENAQQDGIREVAVDLASADETTVRMLYTVDLIDMLRERIAENCARR